MTRYSPKKITYHFTGLDCSARVELDRALVEGLVAESDRGIISASTKEPLPQIRDTSCKPKRLTAEQWEDEL